MSHINVDPGYNVIDRDDFETMIQVHRYADRSPDFDEIIGRTHEHFWNPLDPDYIDFSRPFDMTQDSVIPQEMVAEFHSAVGDRMDAGQKIEFTNQSGRFMLSQILHGEQGALSLSTSLCQILVDPGAVEYACNQVREEARHVTAFTEYMKARFDGEPYPVGPTLGRLMHDIYLAPEVYKKLVGMQMLIELCLSISSNDLSQEVPFSIISFNSFISELYSGLIKFPSVNTIDGCSNIEASIISIISNTSFG